MFTVLAMTGLFLQPLKSNAGPSCTCRYAGQSFQVNSCVCITTSALGPQVACCGMVVNNTSWTFTKNACPSAALPNGFMQPVEIAQSQAEDRPVLRDTNLDH